MNIVFMGTPEFAVPSLKLLSESGHSINAVFTRPDKPAGRNRKVRFQPVKSAACELELKTLQPEKVTVEELRPYSPDLIVVVAFHQILPEQILNLPRHGCLNVHSSLLPKYRGSSPINRAVLNGENISGVTTMKLDKGMDTGDIYLQRETVLTEDETASSLHDRLSIMGAELLIETVEQIDNGTACPVPQDHNIASYAPMMIKEDGRIDWSRSSRELDCHVRGMTPWPGSFSELEGKLIKILKGKKGEEKGRGIPGEILKSTKDKIIVSCGKGDTYIIETIQPAGKKDMTGGDFIRGGYGRQGMRFGDCE